MPTKTDDLGRVEAALTALFRWGNRPRVRERIVATVGVRLDRPLYGILGRLQAAGPQRTSDLASHLGVDISTVSRQVGQLEGEGLVGRGSDPNDRRAAMIRLTAAGADLLSRLRAARREYLSGVLEGWSQTDIDDLGRLLERLTEDLADRWGVAAP
jgi:DNA-binding MarR family transcriptional regulator